MLNGYEIPIMIGLVVLMFGSSQIPKLAKNLGRAQKEFKDGIAEGQAEAEANKSNADAETGAKSNAETGAKSDSDS